MNYIHQGRPVFVIQTGTKLVKTKISKENKERSDFIRNLIKNSKENDELIQFELEVNPTCKKGS